MNIECVSSYISGLDLNSEAGVHEAFLRAGSDDASLYSLIRYLRMQTLKTRQLTDESFSSIAYFYVDSQIKWLGRYASKMVAVLEGRREFDSLMAETGGHVEGVQLSNAGGNQFAIFLPDASEPGRFRFSLFDLGGFFNHSTYDSYPEALAGAWEQGYRKRVYNKLESLCVRSEWAKGSHRTALIQQHNLGKIDYKEYLRVAAA